jgi:hypothetical protein
VKTVWIIAYLLNERFVMSGCRLVFGSETEAWAYLNKYRSTFNSKGTPMPTSLYLKD